MTTELSVMSEGMPENERIWLTEAKAGNEQAFTRVVEAYQRPVFNLCYRMLGNAVEAEDAAQESFLRAYRNLGRYDVNRPFISWILTIASNYCIDQTRKRKMTLISLDSIPPWQQESGPKPGPEGRLVKGELQEDVQELLSALAPKDRAVIVLRYWYDLSYEEIAEQLTMTVSAVKSRLHRARKQLAQEWIERGDPLWLPGGVADEASGL